MAAAALAQTTPVISPGGVVNAASYRPSVAPGSIAAVFGQFPAGSPTWASGTPLPAALANQALRFNGTDWAPLFFASPLQANLQLPWELSGQPATRLEAHSSGQISAPASVDLIAFAPGIFSVNQQGAGQGAILDAGYRLVDAANPATPGVTVLQIFCTGLGAVTNRPQTGHAASAGPLSYTAMLPTVTIGSAMAPVLYSGLAPGLAGAYQVNALVPGASATGDAVPVTISAGGYTSNTVTIAVRAPAADQDPDVRAAALLARMTLDEKALLVRGQGGPPTNIPPLPRGAGGYVRGVPRLGIPDLYFSDGSVGVANSLAPSTALPSSIASAATFDLNQAYRYGTVIGKEMRAYGLNVNLGGNVNLIGREPRGGRIFETKGEDPILAGKITAAHIRGIQDQHVIGGMKHYALNDQETNRTTANVQISERAARESDLLAFEIALKDSDVQSVMCSYNLVNGDWACENDHLLNQILKQEWGFRGFVMSDWWGTHSTVRAALAGLDQEQPNAVNFGNIRQAVESGQIPLARLDNMVHRILRAMFAAGLFDHPESLGPVDRETGQAVAQETLEQGAVLLKNAGGQLPLNVATVRSIAVIGGHADRGVANGSGSARVVPYGPYFTEGFPCPPCWAEVVWVPSSPLAAIRAKAPGASVTFDDGSSANRAAAAAASAEVAIVFVTQWESEGMDRPSLNFTDLIHASAPQNQDALVAAVAAANPRTIVVLENGGPVVMPWLNNVSAVLEAWYPGQRGGEAITNLLFGTVNPSGKLPMTFPASTADLPRPVINAGPNDTTVFPVDYNVDGFNVGYKWFEARNAAPLFPFGFGLSYTTFEFSNKRVVNNLAAARPHLQVTFDLKNTGPVAGAEVALLYLGLPPETGEPPRRLVAWQKVLLDPGALQHVTIEIDPNDSSHPLSIWDPQANAWRIAPGEYKVYLGTEVIGTVRIG